MQSRKIAPDFGVARRRGRRWVPARGKQGMELFHHPAIAVMAFPVLLVAIAIEAFFYRRAKGKPYPWRQSGLSLVIAVGHALSGVINQAVIISLVAVFAWQYRITTVPIDAWWALPLLFVLEEFAYYWYHRAAHRVRLLCDPELAIRTSTVAGVPELASWAMMVLGFSLVGVRITRRGAVAV